MNSLNPPKISVLLPVYNAEKYIEQAIQSILNQTFPNFELIIINDGSTDNSLNIIKSITDSRILIINQENKGLISTLNHGIDISKGEYIARMDADDIALPERFEAQLKLFIQNDNLGLCGTSTMNFGAINNQKTRSNNDQFLKSYLLFGPPFAHPSIMIKRSILIQNNIRYDENFTHCEDFAMWSAMQSFCEFSNVEGVLLKYRVHPEQITNQHSDTVLDAHFIICNKNLASLQLAIQEDDFLAYIAKKKHKDGLRPLLEIYVSIIDTNSTYQKFDDEQLLKVISEKTMSQLLNFYGIVGLLYIFIYHQSLLKNIPFFTALRLSTKRTLLNIYKKVFK